MTTNAVKYDELNHVAKLIMEALEARHGEDPVYLDEKFNDLKGTNKFTALLALNAFDEKTLQVVAELAQCSVDSLRTTVQTLRYF